MSSIVGLWLRLFRTALVLGIAVACGDGTRTPVGPSDNTRSEPGTVTGLVRGEVPLGSRIPRPHPPLRDVEVTVVTGPAAGSTTRTREDGTYTMSLRGGTFKLRFTHEAYEPIESSEMTMGNGQIAMPEIVLRTAPWAVGGLVTDSVGNPVPDVDVTIRPGDAIFSTYGIVKTDAAGRYRFTSARPHWDFVLISASTSGFEPLREQRVSCCDPDSNTTYDMRLVRVISVTPTAPSVLRVGESVELPASVVVFDNGTTRSIFVFPTSNAPSVVAVNRSDHWYAMRAVITGVAVLTFDLLGTSGALQVRVVP